MGLATQLWMPFVVSVVALGVAGAAGAQVYAAVRDELSRRPSGVDVELISTVRMGFTLGWVVGPVLGHGRRRRLRAADGALPDRAPCRSCSWSR